MNNLEFLTVTVDLGQGRQFTIKASDYLPIKDTHDLTETFLTHSAQVGFIYGVLGLSREKLAVLEQELDLETARLYFQFKQPNFFETKFSCKPTEEGLKQALNLSDNLNQKREEILHLKEKIAVLQAIRDGMEHRRWCLMSLSADSRLEKNLENQA